MKRTLSTISMRGAWIAALLLGSLQACTKLDEVPQSSITPGTFYNNEAEALAGLAGVYAQLRGAFPGYRCAYYVLSEISTDEMVVPTRGQDWYDNGRWLEMHRQTWTATSPSGLQDINSAWVNDFTGIANANVVLSALQSRTVMDSAKQAGIIAELRALRADTFVKNFRADNNLSPENIFVVKFINQDGLGFPILQTTLHYNQFTPTPWNGFATLAQTYTAFDTVNDQRKKIFLVGPQFNLETGDTVCIRPGCAKGAPRLVFTPSIADVTQATEGEGVRIYKWPYDPKHVAQNNGNDFAYFRLAEMYLIKAEAEVAGATPTPPGGVTALALVRAVRARSFPGGDTLTVVNQDAILRERLFELAFEAKRRTDLIRFGKYIAAWQFKAAGDQHPTLMPLPQSQRSANSKLDQNPGY